MGDTAYEKPFSVGNVISQLKCRFPFDNSSEFKLVLLFCCHVTPFKERRNRILLLTYKFISAMFELSEKK